MPAMIITITSTTAAIVLEIPEILLDIFFCPHLFLDSNAF
jgi:hypothetical protein